MPSVPTPWDSTPGIFTELDSGDPEAVSAALIQGRKMAEQFSARGFGNTPLRLSETPMWPRPARSTGVTAEPPGPLRLQFLDSGGLCGPPLFPRSHRPQQLLRGHPSHLQGPGKGCGTLRPVRDLQGRGKLWNPLPQPVACGLGTSWWRAGASEATTPSTGPSGSCRPVLSPGRPPELPPLRPLPWNSRTSIEWTFPLSRRASSAAAHISTSTRRDFVKKFLFFPKIAGFFSLHGNGKPL